MQKKTEVLPVGSLAEEVAAVERELEAGGAGRTALPRWGAGRPPTDPYPAKTVTLYLREDVVRWLQEEAGRRGNGWSPARIVVELVRESMTGQWGAALEPEE